MSLIQPNHAPHGHYTLEVVVHFSANQAQVIVPLPRRIEELRSVYVREVSVAGATVLPNLWRLSLSTQLDDDIVTNAPGQGFVFNIKNATLSSTVYDDPRLFTTKCRGYLSELSCSLRRLNAAGTMEPPAFDSASFHLVFVCKHSTWDPDRAVQNTINEPLNAQGQFSTRAPFI